MRRTPKVLAALVATLCGTHASATLLLSPSSGVPLSLFSGSLGTYVDGAELSGSAQTFSGTIRAAVYREASGTLDFLYQFYNWGPGTDGVSNAISRMSFYQFDGFTIDAEYSDADLDGAGIFTVANNPGTAATADRSDGVIGINYDVTNKVALAETSSTYIFRTDATSYGAGTASVIDGSTLTRTAFAPAAVPELGTWMAMAAGFGMLGRSARVRRRSSSSLA
ncbi:hypothetical protein [Sphingomonas nostoxanthinifaciens]|uniref:hypothetical protein n=1 Tax=Sphingomonas nostoxanthinifaciens TaxID=2872652 RepID=UPI001CC1D398|nr:hypothetical protein [Sphingomonas nostoxanthinifaciens]UAK23236.1 hypothetical protein K8P63_12540 [Sphingomonas nostoxanthinifaciens]